MPSGRVFVPVGVNYDHDQKPPCPRLLEEYWESEWAEVEADFREIAQLGSTPHASTCSLQNS